VLTTPQRIPESSTGPLPQPYGPLAAFRTASARPEKSACSSLRNRVTSAWFVRIIEIGLCRAMHPIASPINPIAPVLHPTVVGRAARAAALLDVTKSLDPGRLARRQGRIALQEVFSP
jgi:hypothetical protein